MGFKFAITPTFILCLSGFFHSFNPSEAYLTPYLMGPQKNFTADECVNQIFPVWSYSYLSFLVPVFLLTDYLKYKPVIIMEGACYVACWLLLLFGKTVLEMQIMQVLFGMATAAQIGYYSYIYSIVSEEEYQQVTSYTRTVVLLGYFLGATLAQLLVSFANIDYLYLNYIALVNKCIGFFISFFLPMPRKTFFFYAKKSSKPIKPETLPGKVVISETNQSLLEDSAAEKENTLDESSLSSLSWKKVIISLLNDARSVYSDHVLLRWSIWWALSTCGYMLVVNYVQNLWETIYSSTANQSKVYNGAVEAFATVLGAVGAFSVGFVKLDWTKWGEWALGCCSIFKFALLLAMYFTESIWLSYSSYVIYIFLYNLVITIAQFRLAVGLSSYRVALVFGVDTFAAVALNVILTLIVIDDVGFGMDVKTLFVIYSCYFALLSVIFLSHAFYLVVSSASTTASANEDVIER